MAKTKNSTKHEVFLVIDQETIYLTACYFSGVRHNSDMPLKYRRKAATIIKQLDPHLSDENRQLISKQIAAIKLVIKQDEKTVNVVSKGVATILHSSLEKIKGSSKRKILIGSIKELARKLDTAKASKPNGKKKPSTK